MKGTNDMKRMMRLLSLIIAVCLIAVSTLADTGQSGKETFDRYPGSSIFRDGVSSQLNAGPLTLTGGQTLTNSPVFGSGTVYATAGAVYSDPPRCQVSFMCSSCNDTIIIRSAVPFQRLVVDLLQANVPVLNGQPINYLFTNIDNPNQFFPFRPISGTSPSIAIPWVTHGISIHAEQNVDPNPSCGLGDGFWFWAVDNIEYDLAPPVRVLTGAGQGPDPDHSPTPLVVKDDNSVDVTYPLGLPFYLQVQKKNSSGNWETIDASYTTRRGETPVSHTYFDRSIYDTRRVWAYDAASTSDSKVFQTVHTGDTTINVTPQNAEAFEVHLHVVKPNSLGAAPNTYDSRIIDLADEAGIPPQYIKGQAAVETGGLFNGFAWQYCPISIDLGELQQPGAGLLRLPPLTDYLLKEPYELPEGHFLCPSQPVTLGEAEHDCAFSQFLLTLSQFMLINDIQPRYSHLKVVKADKTIGPLTPADDAVAPVTIRRIFDANGFPPPDNIDPSPQSPPIGGGNTGGPISGRLRPAPHPSSDRLAITAQTPLASKYGLMQVSPVEAIARGEWHGVETAVGSRNYRFNPSLLFDVQQVDDAPSYLKERAGSLIPGISRDIINYAGGSEPGFRDRDAYELTLSLTFEMYRNGGSPYSSAVMQYAATYLPGGDGNVTPPPVPNESCVPVIASLSSNATVTPGGSVVLSVATEPGSNAVNYQWYTGQSGNTAAPVPNGDARIISITPSGTADYWVAITNVCGTTSSNSVHVTVAAECPAVTITSNPSGGFITSGGTYTLHATAAGATTYQWYVGRGAMTPGMDGDRSMPIPNSNTPDLTVQPTVTTSYWVLAGNGCTEVASTTALVAVDCTPPSISTQPQSSNIGLNESAVLSVDATGTAPLDIRWLTTDGVLAGQGATISVSPSSPTTYFARVANACGYVETNRVVVTPPCVPPTITAQSQNATIESGHTTTLSVTVSGSSPMTVEWRDANGGLLGTGVSVIAAPTATTTYHAHVTNSCGSADSTPVTITVTAPAVCSTPVISGQPASQSVQYDQQVTLSVATDAQDVHYQWYKGPSGDTSAPIAGATASTYVVTTYATASYWVRVTALCGPSADSNAAVLTVCDPTSAVTISGTTALVRGQSTTLNAFATGTGVTYQWYLGEMGDTRNPIYNGAQSITVTPLDPAPYWVRATGACGSATAAAVTVSVCALPAFDLEPYDVTIQPGTSTTLSSWATDATTTPLTYQWYEGVSGDVTKPVGTGPDFTTPVLSAETHYWVRVTCGTCGPIDSRTVTVSMCLLPATLSGPADPYIALGQTAHLVIPPFSPAVDTWFFWYQGASGDTSHPIGDFGGDWGLYNYLDVSPAETTQYWAAIQTGYGSCISTTGTTTVHVCVPTITQQPTGLMINGGQQATLTVVATLAQSYQWYTGASGDTSSPIAGATGASIVVSPAAATSYWVRVTGSCSRSADSNAATITVCQPPAITTQPSGASITRGQSATIGVGATGTSLSYQWYQGTSGNTANPVYGNTSSITVNPLNPIDYWVQVSGACGTAQNSNTAHVSVCTTPVITQQPVTQYVFLGQTATFTVAASEATSELLHYQWYVDGGTPVGTDSPAYTTPAVNSSHSYFVRVIAASCYVDSNSVLATGCTLPQVINSGTTQNVSIGQSVTLSCVISPGTGNTFVWYYGPAGDVAHSTQVSSNSSNTYTFTAAAGSGGTYWATVSRTDDGCVSHTNAYTVNVCVPTITTQPAAGTMINSGQSLTLTVAANTSGLTYQWYVGTSGTTTTPISGATSSSVTVNPTTATNYWVKVTGTCGQSVNSNTAAVTICAPPAITSQPAPNSYIVRGANVSLGVTATGNGLTYQWYQGTSGNTSTPLAATTPGLTIAPLNPVDYWVQVTGTCGSVNSNTAHVAVCVTPAINTQPASLSIFSGGSTTLSVSASEGTGETLHYQWYKNSTTPVGADSPTLNTGALTTDTTFYVHITAASGTCSVDSSTATVSMCPLPQTVTGAPNQNTTPGQSVRLQLGSMPGATAYQWYNGTSGNTASPIGGWQAANYLDVNPSTTSNYWAQVQNGSCVSNTTTTTVNVCIPTITTQPQNVTTSTSATLTVASNLTGSTYQWYVGTSGTTTNPISGATSASVTVSPASTTNYWCKVTGTCGTSVNSNTATVTICAAPNITVQPVNASPVYRLQASGLSVTATGTNLTYQWYTGASGDTSHPVSGATNAVYSTTAYNSERYWVRVTGMCGTRDSNAAWISVIPQFLQQPVQTTYLSSGSRVMLSVSIYTNAYLHYAWCYDSNGQTVPGSPDSPVWITPDITASNTYFCRVTSGIASAESYRASVYLCDGGNSAGAPYAQNAGGSCRYLWSQAGGNYDHIEWYQGQKGDTSYQIGTGYYVYTCSNVGTTVWYRVVGYDSNQGQSCYTDSPSFTVQ